MSAADVLAGWLLVNAALVIVAICALLLWSRYERRQAHRRVRMARMDSPTPSLPGRSARPTGMGWLVSEAGMAAHAPTQVEADTLLDRALAARADNQVLREIADAFNREQNA